MDMLGRKALIKKIVERGAELVGDPRSWLGDMAVSTRHTVYRFRDGICIAVHRQDTGNGRGGDYVGMKMIGWLVDEDTAPVVSAEWRPGASAILLRPGANGDSLALTSPTIQLRREALRASQVQRSNGPPSYHDVAASMTRIGVPRGR